eukprot:81717-Chlamydomonas_euryale.AAC.1
MMWADGYGVVVVWSERVAAHPPALPALVGAARGRGLRGRPQARAAQGQPTPCRSSPWCATRPTLWGYVEDADTSTLRPLPLPPPPLPPAARPLEVGGGCAAEAAARSEAAAAAATRLAAATRSAATARSAAAACSAAAARASAAAVAARSAAS